MILITGGLGLIGHNVVSLLELLNKEVVIVDNRTNYNLIPQDELDYLTHERLKKIQTKRIINIDISNKESINKVFKAFNPDIVIHLASFPRQKAVNANPHLGARYMIEGLINLLECSASCNVSKFVYTSSSMVYGDFTDYVTEEAECHPIGQYGIMKLAGEWLIRDYSRRTDISHVILRPSAVYGPLDVEDRVISKFLLTAMRGETLKVRGETETLDFTYVDDAAEGIVNATLSPNTDNQTYNITKSHSKTLLEAAKLAVSLVGRGDIIVTSKDEDFPSRGALDITKAKRDFNFNPKVDIEDGFKYYYEWLNESPYWKEKLGI